MVRRLVVTCALFAAVAACVVAAGFALEPKSAIGPIRGDSLCPVVGCSGDCHGYGDVPQPNGVAKMACPEATCLSAECHAWDTLQGRYKQASDASMNIWILAPVALVVGLVALVGALSKPQRKAVGDAGADTPGAPRTPCGPGAAKASGGDVL